MRVSAFIPVIGLMFFCSCQKDQIQYDETPSESETAQTVSADCSELNADVASLQALAIQAMNGGCVVAVSEEGIQFDSGEFVSVQVRDSYGFEFVNPLVSISGKNWAMDGTARDFECSSYLLQLKGEDGAWYYSFDEGQTWSFLSDIEAGASVPVFSGFTAGELDVRVSLSSGVTFSYEYLEED